MIWGFRKLGFFHWKQAPGTVEKVCSKFENVIKIDLDTFRTRISQMYPEFLVCVFSYSYIDNPPTDFGSHVKLKLKKTVL